ncbi:hypothetical protein NW064_02250 [Mycoplasmopsis felis]|nr:hypothetical protein [Mycoplasmopsis felis]UWW01206.1 hypothetical protein NW064_02250 [Mycoplasmopsis felis]
MNKFLINEKVKKLTFIAPLVQGEKGTHQNLLEKLNKEGYLRVKIDGNIYSLDDVIDLNKNQKRDIDLLIFRTEIIGDKYNEISESINIATNKSGGLVKIENTENNQSKIYSKLYSLYLQRFFCS